MKKQFKWSVLLIVLPIACLIFCLLPNTVQIQHIVQNEPVVTSCAILWGVPVDTTLSYCNFVFAPLLLLTLIPGISFFKNEGDGMGKGTFVMSLVTLAFTLMPMIDGEMTWVPYFLLPATMAVNAVIAIRLTTVSMRTKYEDPVDEFLNRGH